ncbi:MAG: endo-1,4-beta-xylanase [Planctomycetes bacterium]|nr:endo-1,4-beta-xylanase [Planctomycetota bacterium]
MHFLVPSDLPAETADGIRRAYLGGGYDHSPVPTHIEFASNQVSVRRDDDESGYLSLPWEIADIGRLMCSTSTLMERSAPYRLLVEIARGKVNQVRSQASDCKLNGTEITPAIEQKICEATKLFGQAVLEGSTADASNFAMKALTQAYTAAEMLVSLQVQAGFKLRKERQQTGFSHLSCRLAEVPTGALADAYQQTFSSVCVPMTWRDVEPIEANYQWEATDRVLTWALDHQLQVTAGPLIDFSRRGVPDWLTTWEGDLPSLASFMCDYIETTVTRYRHRVRRWVISSGSNACLSLGLSEDDLIRLTARLAEAAWGIDPNLEVVIGLSQPWGEYRSGDYFNYSPFVFADTLLRAGLPFSGFELEWHMGSAPRGIYCRDPLDASRLLDLFGMLGCPLQVSLSYPSATDRDPQADPDLQPGKSGWWHGLTPVAQAEWAETFSSLALAKSHVIGVCWDHFTDLLPHRFPNGGLVDMAGNAKPALERLKFVRDTYLRTSSGSTLFL